MSKNAEISVNRAEIVEKERERLVELGAERGVRPEDVVTHERGGLTILFAARANGEALVINHVDQVGLFRYEGTRAIPNVNLVFQAPHLVTMVETDGTVVCGLSAVIRAILTEWYIHDVVGQYEKMLSKMMPDFPPSEEPVQDG